MIGILRLVTGILKMPTLICDKMKHFLRKHTICNRQDRFPPAFIALNVVREAGTKPAGRGALRYILQLFLVEDPKGFAQNSQFFTPLLNSTWYYILPDIKCERIMPVATAAFSDSAPPRLGIVILCVACAISSGFNPFDSLPIIRMPAAGAFSA